MPRFKTNKNIFINHEEYFDPNWMDYDTLQLPPKIDWDYSRELQVEDIDLWEVIFESSGGIGVYAAWLPYAEFYMVTTGWKPGTLQDRIVETYYGKNSSKKVFKRCQELGIPLSINKIWIEEEKMWLYS